MSHEHSSPPEAHPERVQPLVVNREHIPSELLEYPQWICWRYVERGNKRKPDKQPVNPHNLHNAGVHWANTWSTSKDAYEMYIQHTGKGIDGIGFVLTHDDPFVGVDIDSCLQDGDIAPQAQDVIQQLQSYTEISPSGRGLRILVACPQFLNNARSESLEVYSHSRFLTITGHHLAHTPATINPTQLADLESLLPQQQVADHQLSRPSEPQRVRREEDAGALWQRIFEHDKYGAQHLRRFQGDTSQDRNDHSYTVIRLLNCLAAWTQCDTEMMRAMMLMSSLKNTKWLEKRGKGDWLDHQIADAVTYIRSRAR